MIKTLEDVHVYCEAKAADSPSIADELRIPTPGLSADEVSRVRAALPGLPDNYLAVIAHLDMEIAEFQFTRLTPSAYGDRRGEMVRFLLERNSEENYFYSLLTEQKLYEVASYGNGDLICVSAQDTQIPGEVIWLDHESQDLHRFANNFEQLVVGLARLDEQNSGSGPRGDDGVKVFAESIKNDFGLDDEQVAFWSSFAEMTLLVEDWDE